MELQKIIDKFNIDSEVVSFSPYGNGHINNTFLIKTISGKRYILQSLNTNVFRKPEEVMSNICKVTDFLKTKNPDPRSTMHPINAKDGTFYHIENDIFWRMYHFIEDTICLELPEDENDFYECAMAFGTFQKHLDDFPVDELYETIPDFHNTPVRYNDFLKAVDNNLSGRANKVLKEIEFVKSRKEFYSVLYDYNKEGKLPFRVTHNDTKSNNVMLDAKTRKALCVIDLDTIMPGFSVTDFGDAIRFGASTASEDEKDLSKVNIDLKFYEAYAKGFIKGCGGLLKEDEIMLLPEGAKMMTIECGMRFLADYLNGDTYFKTAYPEHNLDRCRTQFKLVEEMENNWAEMKQIIKNLI